MKLTKSSTPLSQDLPAGVKVVGHWEDQIVVQFGEGTETERSWLFLQIAELIKSPDRLACELARHGHIEFTRGAKLRSAAQALLHQSLETKTLCIPHGISGSMMIDHAGKQYRAYAWRGSLYFFGDRPSCKIRAQRKPTGVDWAKVEGWKQDVGALCENNPNLIVTLCHALSAPLRVEHKRPFIIIQLVGPSSVGKTTTQKVVTSLWMSPSAELAIPQLQGTAIGVIDRLSQSPGQAICFQDTRQHADAAELEHLLFSIADASSRFKYGQTTKPLQTTLILSNERSILDMASRDKANLDEGVFARYLEIHADEAHGVFHDIHEADSGAEFAHEIETRAEEYSGAVWPAWIASLSEGFEAVVQGYECGFRSEQDELIFELNGEKLAAVNQRLVRELSYSLWVGILAVKMEILPFSTDEIRAAFRQVLESHLARRATGSTPISERAIEAVRGYIDQNPGRFPKLKAVNLSEIKTGCSGYRYQMRDGQELFLFFPTLFRKEFVCVFGSAIYDYLSKADLLETSAGRGYQYQVRLPKNGGQKSFIAIKATICFDPE